MFSSDITNRETCDKCGKLGTEQNPVVELVSSSRYDRHVIFIHEGCFNRALSLAAKRHQTLKPGEGIKSVPR